MTKIRPVVFVHVPKTAGMSLHYALEAAFQPANVLRVGNKDDYRAYESLSNDDLQRYRVISGHFLQDEIYGRLADKADYVTVLRDPIERILSAFNYICSWSEHPAHHVVSTMTFGEYLVEHAEKLRSQVCLQLTGQGEAEAAAVVLEERYALVGAMPNLRPFIEALGALIGQELTLFKNNETAGFGKVTMTSKQCKLLIEITEEDEKLFEWVKSGVLKSLKVP